MPARERKRYVLFFADNPLTEAEISGFGAVLVERFGIARAIPVDGNPRAAIIRTVEPVARHLRAEAVAFSPGGVRLRPVLTSGAIGNLKRSARKAAANGKIHE